MATQMHSDTKVLAQPREETDYEVRPTQSEAVDSEPTESYPGDAIDEGTTADTTHETAPSSQRRRWNRVLGIALLLAMIAAAAGGFGYLTWQTKIAAHTENARAQSVRAATDGTIAILTYRAETVDKELNAARDLLTGSFRDEYTKLINSVVIPGAKQNRISATVSVPAVASITATPNHAVVLVFVNQTTLFSDTPPSSTSSSVQVTVDKVDNRWLISQFEPV